MLVLAILYQRVPVGMRWLYVGACVAAVVVGITGIVWLRAARRRKQQREWAAAAARGQADAAREEARRRSVLAGAGSTWRVRDLSPKGLEEFAAQVFREKGYETWLTKETGDGGIDVYMKNPHQKVELVQCKQWSYPVGVVEVRAFAGVVHHEGALVGYLFAPGGFTSEARKWAEREPVVLLDEGEILRCLQNG